MSIDILLGTYNGERYLREQLESLLAQTVGGWRLLVRDDGSKDGTVAIIREYEKRYPGKVVEVDANGGNLGVVKNFARLLESSNADYVMFCDQDDVWYPHKIKITLEVMRALEDKNGMAKPLLAHTDARLVDERLKLMRASFHHALSHRPEQSALQGELVQNTAHGCTVMINRPLVNLALPLPKEARMHDMWVHLLAQAVGCTHYLDLPTLDYRQHGKNVIGALPEVHGVEKTKRKATQTMDASFAQARAVLERVGPQASADVIETLEKFIAVPGESWIAGTKTLLCHYCPKPRFKNAVRILLR